MTAPPPSKVVPPERPGRWPERLLAQASRPPAEPSVVVPSSTPVVSFGDLMRAKVVTLGINPSTRQFVRQNGSLLDGPERRLATLPWLGLACWEEMDRKSAGRVLAECAGYFEPGGAPYRRWFDPFDRLLRAGLGVSYYDGTACHLNVVPWATDPVWRDLDRAAWRGCSSETSFVVDQLRDGGYRLVVVNGRTAMAEVAAAGLVEWTVDHRLAGPPAARLCVGRVGEAAASSAGRATSRTSRVRPGFLETSPTGCGRSLRLRPPAAACVYQPRRSTGHGLEDVLAVDDVEPLVVGDGRVDVGGDHADAIAHPDRCVGRERHVLVGAEEDRAALDGRVAVVHAQGLEPAVGHGPVGRHRDHRGQHREGLGEGQSELAVGRVHEQVGTGLDLGGPVVDVVGAGPAGGDDVPAHVGRRAARSCSMETAEQLDPRGPLGQADDVALVAHDARGRPGPAVGPYRPAGRRPPAGSRSGGGRR